MFIYNQAADTLGSANLSGQQVDSYNSEFLQYGGIKQGSQVRTLLNNVRSHNRNAEDASQIIKVNTQDYTDAGGTEPAPSEDDKTKVDDGISSMKILAAKTYKVTFAYDPNSGYVTAIGIVEQTSN